MRASVNIWVWNPAPDGWGANPATFEALATTVAAVFAIVAALIAWRSWRASRSEISDRMRPWVGLYDFEFHRDAFGAPKLRVLLQNRGPLPAQDAHLKVELRPRTLLRYGEIVVPIVSEKVEQKILMPSEDGDYGIKLAPYPDLETWISDKRDIAVFGTFTYALGKRVFESKFQAELWFSRPEPPIQRSVRFWEPKAPRKLVQTHWRNVSAT